MKIDFNNFIHTVSKEQLGQLIKNLKGANDPELNELICKLEKVK